MLAWEGSFSVDTAFVVVEFVVIVISGVIRLVVEAFLVGDVLGTLRVGVVAPWVIGSVSTVPVVALVCIAAVLAVELVVVGFVVEIFIVAVAGPLLSAWVPVL